jgi:hypothetical protein
MLRNVTVSTADLAVELVGDGVNTTFAENDLRYPRESPGL